MADSPDPFGSKEASNNTTARHITSEDERDERKALNRAKRDAKRTKREAAKAAEEAMEEAKREARRKRNEALKVKVIDGYVIDESGRIIRPYTRAERFLDNKPLVYALLIVFIIICLALTVVMML
jgi:vacuolar-type H+-ATPase subunit E/Vma4